MARVYRHNIAERTVRNIKVDKNGINKKLALRPAAGDIKSFKGSQFPEVYKLS